MVYNTIFVKTLNFSYNSTNKYIDKGILEFFGPFGVYLLLNKLSIKTKQFTPTVIFFVIG